MRCKYVRRGLTGAVLISASTALAGGERLVSIDGELTPEPQLEVDDHTPYVGPALGLLGASCQATLSPVGQSGSRAAVLFGDGVAPFTIAMRTREGESGGMEPAGEYIYSIDADAPLTTDTGLVAHIVRLENAPGTIFRPRALVVHDTAAGARAEIVRHGDVPVNSPLAVFLQSGSDGVTVNNNGQVAARVVLGEKEDLEAIVTGSGAPGTLRAVAVEGDAAPGSGNFDFIYAPAINDAGMIAFAADLEAATGVYTFPWAIYRDTDGTLEEIVREGDADPFGFLITDLGFTRPCLNAHGDLAYWASVDVGVGGDPVSLVYVSADGTHTRLVISGDPMPGTGGAVEFSLVSGRTYAINDAAQVAFKGRVDLNPTGLSDRVDGVFRADGPGGQIVTAALVRDPAPGGGTFRTLYDFAMNESGQIAFEATVDMPDGSTPRGVFFYDDDNGLQEIVREGDVILGGTIEQLVFSGTDVTVLACDDRSGLNDHGEVAYWFRLDSSEGVIDREGVAIWPAGAGPGCPADLNNDGAVDSSDLAALLAFWDQPSDADFNGDGTTDSSDLAEILAAWGDCPA